MQTSRLCIMACGEPRGVGELSVLFFLVKHIILISYSNFANDSYMFN